MDRRRREEATPLGVELAAGFARGGNTLQTTGDAAGQPTGIQAQERRRSDTRRRDEVVWIGIDRLECLISNSLRRWGD